MSRPFRVSVGPSRLQTRVERKKWHWETLVKRLQTYHQLDISYDEYMALPKDEQANLKDVGYFICGQFNGSGRLLENMARRCCITLDVDHIDWLDIDEIRETYGFYEHVVHSTLKHCNDTPRLRLVFPLAKDIPPEQYEPAARAIAARLGMDCFDDTTFQPARIMFWPAVTADGDIFKYHNKGEILPTEALLDKYDDWTDFGEWPHSSRTGVPRGPLQRAEWPLDKGGIIGAFCRTHDIHSAIATFELPYLSTDFDNRYIPDGASGAAGAVVYDDVFLYSNHESDVVGLQNVNAWDLVRMHRFGDLDASVDPDTRMMERPSSKAMTALAMNDDDVHRELTDMELRPNGEDTSPTALSNDKDDRVATAPTFDNISKAVDQISDQFDTPAIEHVLNNMAAARLDPFQIDQLAGQLKAKASVSKGVTTRAVESRSKQINKRTDDGMPRDLQRELIAAALDEHYEGGRTLKRIGDSCWRYQSGMWSLVSDEPVRGRVGRTFTRIKETRPADATQLVAMMEDANTSTLVNSVTQLMFDDLAVVDDNEDPLKLMRSFALPVINCTNCEIQFNKKGKMRTRDHKPESFYTIRINAAYDPKAKCPEWDQFMQLVFSNTEDPDDMVRHFEEIGGYIIQMSRWLKTWIMLHGPTDTGKSTAAMILQEMLGSSFLTKPMAIAAKSNYAFDEEAIIGKLLMVDDDFPAGGALPDGFMKKYSEEKPATANIKFGRAVNFRARALPMLLTNHWPIVHDTTPAFLERALILPFTYRIKGAERDDQARARMMQELPGILNRFLNGLKRLRKRGNWSLPITCYQAADEWAARANPFLSFLAECCTVNPNARIERSELYDAFCEWYAQQSGNKATHNIMHKRAFFERCREKLGKEVKSSGAYFFKGIRIADDAPLRVNELKVLNALNDEDWDQ